MVDYGLILSFAQGKSGDMNMPTITLDDLSSYSCHGVPIRIPAEFLNCEIFNARDILMIPTDIGDRLDVVLHFKMIDDRVLRLFVRECREHILDRFADIDVPAAMEAIFGSEKEAGAEAWALLDSGDGDDWDVIISAWIVLVAINGDWGPEDERRWQIGTLLRLIGAHYHFKSPFVEAGSLSDCPSRCNHFGSPF